MTYRRYVRREIGWGGAAAVLACLGLAGCGDDGGGGCPEIGGSWSVVSDCTGAPSSCTVLQDLEDDCAIELECSSGQILMGKVGKSSVSFKDDSISCSGKLDGLEDEDEDGVINPTIEADCTLEGDMCEVQASCIGGDCTEPKREPVSGGSGATSGGDGDGDGDGPAGQGGTSGVFGMSGNGGQGGSAGLPPAGSGGISGSGGSPAGSGGAGGGDPGACGQCVDSSCSSERAACDATVECGALVDCVLESGCSVNDDDCLQSYCGARLQNVVLDEQDQVALSDFDDCASTFCTSACGGDEPVGGSGGFGGSGGESGGPAPQPCDTCEYADDGYCDEPEGFCPPGTDCTDCGNAGQ